MFLTSEMIGALKVACKIAGPKSHAPVARQVKLTLGDGLFAVQATDLNLQFTYNFFVDTFDENWSALIESKSLATLLKDKEQYDLRVQEEKLFAKLDDFEINFPSGDVSEFPDFPKIVEPSLIKIPQEDVSGFLKDLDWVLVATSVDPTRPNLQGVWVAENRLVGTDGHRLHLVEMDGIDFPFLLPNSIARHLQALAKLESTPISIGFSIHNDARMIIGRGKRFVLTMMEPDGKYPDYRQVFPSSEQNYQITCDGAALSKIISRISAHADNNGLTVRIYPGVRKISLAAHSEGRDVAETKFEPDEIKVNKISKVIEGTTETEEVEPYPLHTGIDAKYLIEALDKDTGTEIQVSMETEKYAGPLLVNTQDGLRKAIIMPIRR